MARTQTTLDIYDVIDFARHVLAMNDDPNYQDNGNLADALQERWGLDIEQFGEIVDRLLGCTIPVAAPLSGQLMHVMGRQNSDGILVALVRKEAKQWEPRQ